MRIPALGFTLAASLLTGCASPSGTARALKAPPTDIQQLDSIQRLNNSQQAKTRVSALKAQALRDTALSLGARSGLAWRAQQINAVLSQKEDLLARIFNFNALVLDDNVLPPVLIEGRQILKLSEANAIRIADRTYEIGAQAKFITAAPHWRDYLWLNYQSPANPDRSLLPRNTEERIVWRKYSAEGWLAGIQQANVIYSENLARLKRDFEGMIRYRVLLAQNMVSAPYVARVDMGVTGGGNKLNVRDRILRITSFPSLQSDSEQWKTEIIPHE